ncbi:oligopeptide transport system ATP-binding protein [Devosia enhydra]|uniref:Oligopeptide transport system ATP-binding protein n=1 Tax=Devosia enhydra TaxID=665118 RepID=A0A1K2I184_9HYPH|nr:ABC transporter ATP-binding protein [Devosia enhydra]SFZ85524.1 oligopeptide transport system ATP-binding protein [Devosia enhydra]
MTEPLLGVKHLCVRFSSPSGPVLAVNDVGFSLAAGEVLGVVGESGSGKSQMFMALGGLLAGNGRATGEAWLGGRNLLGLTEAELNRVRGRELAYVFQDPMTALNPYRTISAQITELLRFNRGMDGQAARAEALRLLERVRIPEARRRLDMFPHEFSGGMRQRVTIAMALSNNPKLLVADEPTTALDVTVQIQVLDILEELRREQGLAVVLITHDMGVVARLAHKVMVVYAGTIVEEGSVEEVLLAPTHPYTTGLLASMPDIRRPIRAITPIPGHPPDGRQERVGCMFAPRCFKAEPVCRAETPALAARTGRQRQACHFPVAEGEAPLARAVAS